MLQRKHLSFVSHYANTPVLQFSNDPEMFEIERRSNQHKKDQAGDLYDFTCDIVAHPSFEKVAPISLMRAVSQSKNPYGRPEDVVLFVAFSGNQCVGYHGKLWIKLMNPCGVLWISI